MARGMRVDLNAQVTKLLKELGDREGREPTAIMRKAIGLYSDLQKRYYGQTITITDEKGEKRKLYFN